MMKLTVIYTRVICLIMTCSFLFLQAYSQGEESIKDMFLEGESSFFYEEFKDALPWYQRILQVDPDNYNINFKIGVCYLNDHFQTDRAIPYLEKAVQGTSPDSKTDSYRESMAPLDAYFYLGNAYHVNNRLDEAIEMYTLFKEVIVDPLDYDIEWVDTQIEACQVAKAQFARPRYFTSANLGNNVNERFEEVNPVVSGDGSTLVFTRKLQFYDAVFYSTKQGNGTWSYPINLTPSFGVDGNTYVTGISYQGDEIFVYRSDDFDGNIYVSKRMKDQWSKLEKLNDNINTKYYESHASLSDDGLTLYFTSNRKGGYGNLDIYKSERRKGGDWGPAINLGPVINTRYHEETPFITDFGKTLYFSSRGHYNMGGYDIFYSTRLDNGQWSVPSNVGYPLNTTNDDLFFAPTADGTHAYYARYDPEDSYGLSDIYMMEVFTDLHPRKFILNGITRTEGNVRTDMSQYQVSLREVKTGTVLDQGQINSSGTYTLDAVSGDLEILITDGDMLLSSERINIPANNPSDIISHTSTIVPGVRAEVPVITAQDATRGELPQITTRTTRYVVTSDQTIPIELEVDRNTMLVVETLVNNQLFNTENFEIGQQGGFLYGADPFQGDNLLRFTVTNDQGLSNTLEVSIRYTPEPEQLAAELQEGLISGQGAVPLADAAWYAGIASMAEGALKDYLLSSALQDMRFGSPGELYDFLIAHAEEGGFTSGEVDELMVRYLAQKNVTFFASELDRQATDSISTATERILAGASVVHTPEVLLDNLFLLAGEDSFLPAELLDGLYQVAASDRDALSMIDLLQSYAAGNLAVFLESLKMSPSGIREAERDDASFFVRSAPAGGYTMEEIASAIRKASYELDVDFLHLALLSISGDSLGQTLKEMDLWRLNIRNASELVTFLLDHAKSDGYTSRDLIDNVERIRTDPYNLIEGYRDILASHATGSLKIFLQQIDIRGLQIDTFEKLIRYLFSQSQYQDFNREMIYQLFIDIIDVANTREFIDLLLEFADERFSSALWATDLDLYSTPLEVIRYLLDASEQYAYDESDLINLLTKILLERKPLMKEEESRGGWLSRLERSELISALIIVNGIIIVLVIILIFRRKQRKEADQPPANKA